MELDPGESQSVWHDTDTEGGGGRLWLIMQCRRKSLIWLKIRPHMVQEGDDLLLLCFLLWRRYPDLL